tara:strand:- start:4171 stop:6564 length:2394 start_codon:yes stop_codon:yes gene_type:complete
MVGGGGILGWLSVLDRKLWRDLWGMKTQALAIAFVIAGGVSVQLLSTGMLNSLQETRRAYYERYLLADVWAPVVRAPQALLSDIRGLDGVQAAETRIRAGALFDMPGMSEPASGEILSLPDAGLPAVNQLYLTRGRTPEADRGNEVVVLESFATAHALQIGDMVSATIHGRRARLTIVGIGLSPEHVYTIAPGEIVPDDRLFGVMWMGRQALARAVDQDGAFNEAVVRLSHGASQAAVIAELDLMFEPFGAPGAYGRDEQISDVFVSSEIDQLRTMGNVLPPIFLLVAAFLVNIVISRLIAVQRAGIGLLKAFGYRDDEVGWHYMKLVAVIGLAGLVIGGGLGIWLGREMAIMYTQYYRFPFLVFNADPRTYAIVIAITAIAILGGAAIAVRRAASLNPADAMTQPPPPDYSKAAGMGITRWHRIDQQTRMILRQIIRWPIRASLTVAGVAASGALLIGTMFFIDSMSVMMDGFFNVSNRYDVSVSFVQPRSRAAYHSIERMPGVLAAEPFRAASARLRHGNLEERAALIGSPPDPQLSRMVDAQYRTVSPPPGGLVLSQDLAIKLDVEAGDMLEIHIAEGRRPVLQVPVSAVTTTLIGSGAQMQIGDLNALLGEGDVVSGAYLIVDPDQVDTLYNTLKSVPLVAGTGLQSLAAQNLDDLMQQNLGTAIWIYTGFAGLIALGVIYNSVRISFAERQRELASLRVLGFTVADVSYILLGEVAFLTLLALPVGAAAGTGMAWYLAQAISSELFRLPFVINLSTFGLAGALLIGITIGSSLLVRHQIERLDMVAVLKTGE